MIDEYVHPCDFSYESPDGDLPTVLTTPEQVLTGVVIAVPDQEAQCTDCGRTLREGERVLEYAYRAADAPQWDAVRCYCRDCRPETISAPTLGTSELLVEAVLGTVSDVRQQSHRICLLEVDPVAASPPTEGTLP
jgi:hypothetical protein